MAVEGLHFMFCDRHALHQLFHSVRPLVGLSIPCQGGRSTVKLGQVVDSCGGIVCFVVQTSEVIGCSGGYFNAIQNR